MFKMKIAFAGVNLNRVEGSELLQAAVIDIKCQHPGTDAFKLPYNQFLNIQRLTNFTLSKLMYEYEVGNKFSAVVDTARESGPGLFLIPDYTNYRDPVLLFGKLVCTQHEHPSQRRIQEVKHQINEAIMRLKHRTQHLDSSITDKYCHLVVQLKTPSAKHRDFAALDV